MPHKLDDYCAIIDARLETYPALSAVRLMAECRAAGYTGGYSQLREYVRSVAPELVVRFETPPGHQAQVDFAEVRFPWGKPYALLVVLGYSRFLWVQAAPHQTMQVLMTGLEAAFRAFGGVPRELLFDQLKAVVIADERPAGGKLLENPEFLRFAAHWGFRIRACRPYRAKTKGKVARPVRYLRGNFLYGREFLGDGDLRGRPAPAGPGKVLGPSSVGVWSTASGNSVTVAWSGPPSPEAKDVLGYAMAPLAMLASAWCAEPTRRVLRVLRRGLD